MIKISIVTISYNQAQFLESAIESIISQDYDNLEYIIVDPGSSDGSREIIERYADRIHKIIFEPDQGPADGLNKGFSHATGDVYGYINADDILLPGALEKVAERFQSNQAIDVLIGNALQLDRNGNVTRKLYNTKWDLRLYFYGGCNVIQQSSFFRRNIFERSGGFNVENRVNWDGESFTAMSRCGANFVKIPDFLGGFRIYPDSISGSGKFFQQCKAERMRIFKEITGRDFRWYDNFLSLFYRSKKKISLISEQILKGDPNWTIEIITTFSRKR